ncbi:MAG TPA: hypothetical protein VFF52_29185 [Isosphaeraceae bacterium]|nr:hypothetical protein [Isosphaeraceae bacterium]
MDLLVSCPCCGATARILAEDLGSLPRCPACGHELTIEPARPGWGAALDDEIQSWLSEPGGVPAGPSSGDATCLTCGYAGLMEFDSAHGDRICPACLSVDQTRTTGQDRTVACPGCGAALDISERDRGKTIICPGCKYFLGCVLPAEKHAYRRARRQPAWDAALAGWRRARR